MRVMMSAAGSAVAPSIIRHLQWLGHYVIGHDCSTGIPGLYVSPKVDENAVGYLHFLARKEPLFDLYIPFLDEELRLFGSIESWLKTASSPSQTLQTFTSKVAQQHALQKAMLPVAPITLEGEVVAKPDRGSGGKGIIRTSDFGVAERLSFDDYLTQKFINGDEYTVDVLTSMDGAFLFAVPRLRIQANGVSVIGKIVMDEEITELTRLVVSKFAFRGPINIQIIRERDTGKLYIIELNPRLSGSCMFTVMAGFDILDATIKLWDGKPFVAPDKIEDGLVIRRHYVEERL